MYCLTFVSRADFPLNEAFVASIVALCAGEKVQWLAPHHAVDIVGIADDSALLRQNLDVAFASYPIDWCVQITATRLKKLLISDMDSTIIGQECIDELADMLGVKAQVSAITERAMQGELDFSTSLTQRVALLKGLPVAMLERVWQERVTLNAGAVTLVRTMRSHGAYTMLVSGGFTFFTERVSEKVGFEAHHANTLEVIEGALTGYVIPPILDKDSKRYLLLAALEARGLETYDSLAVGDGANDAAMIQVAGLGVAYYAKPLLQSQADTSITYTDLVSLLYFQGYHYSRHTL